MSNYILYYGTDEDPLVAPILINNGKAVIGELFGKYFLVGAAQINFAPGIPKNRDPHWFPYPKVNWSPSINKANPNIVWTRFEADENHYLMYIPTNRDEEIIAYKNLLRKSIMGSAVNYTALLAAQKRTDAKKKREMKREQEALDKKEKEDALNQKRKQAASARADRAAKRPRGSFGKKRSRRSQRFGKKR